ncbi:hypothetical protein N0V94_002769 [Neodidymelliopsis sp. IMI 364377]|nr:hypothetical protein N0V94_002769 [Neodidymelliopsis sp. IMI 364377]
MPGRTAEPTDRFQTLVQALSDKLGPCSGIDSDDVDEKELQQLMEDYVSDESEWESHANAHCIMKILKGSLTETRYAWPTVDLNNSEDRPLQAISEKTYQADQVTYMSDKLGLHRISNPDNENYAVSLHLYTPPNAAVYGCNVFNEANGRSTHMAKCTVFSEYGSQVREARS